MPYVQPMLAHCCSSDIVRLASTDHAHWLPLPFMHMPVNRRDALSCVCHAGEGGYGGSFPIAATPGKGGAGGGGWYAFSGLAGAGGGVGVLGQDTSGRAGNSNSIQGGGGSGGLPGSSDTGGAFGGGAPGRLAAGTLRQQGAGGACRIIWGPNRAFPSINTQDLTPRSPCERAPSSIIV